MMGTLPRGTSRPGRRASALADREAAVLAVEANVWAMHRDFG